VTCEAELEVLAELPQIVEPRNFTRVSAAGNSSRFDETDYAFERSWRRPERAIPPLELFHHARSAASRSILRTHGQTRTITIAGSLGCASGRAVVA